MSYPTNPTDSTQEQQEQQQPQSDNDMNGFYSEQVEETLTGGLGTAVPGDDE
mgnify:CR=1 FL=1